MKQCELRTFWEVKALHGNGRLEGVTIVNNKTKEEEILPIDAVIPLLGFHSDLGAIKEWGLDTEKADIKVDQVMATNVPGIYAAGDITSYPGKLKLIATGAGGGVHRGEQRGALHQSEGQGESRATRRTWRSSGRVNRVRSPETLDLTSPSSGRRKNRSSPAPGASSSRSIPITPLFGKSISTAVAAPSEQHRRQLFHPGRVSHHRHDRVRPRLADALCQTAHVGIGGQGSQGTGGSARASVSTRIAAVCAARIQGLVSTRRGHEIEPAEQPAHPAVGLSPLVGERPVAIVGPLGRVADRRRGRGGRGAAASVHRPFAISTTTLSIAARIVRVSERVVIGLDRKCESVSASAPRCTPRAY